MEYPGILLKDKDLNPSPNLINKTSWSKAGQIMSRTGLSPQQGEKPIVEGREVDGEFPSHIRVLVRSLAEYQNPSPEKLSLGKDRQAGRQANTSDSPWLRTAAP